MPTLRERIGTVYTEASKGQRDLAEAALEQLTAEEQDYILQAGPSGQFGHAIAGWPDNDATALAQNLRGIRNTIVNQEKPSGLRLSRRIVLRRSRRRRVAIPAPLAPPVWG